MHKFIVLLILGVVVPYHPTISSLQAPYKIDAVPANPLDWLMKGFYKDPIDLNVNLMGKYVNNAAIFIIANTSMIVLGIILSCLFKCNCSFLKGMAVLIVRCIVILLLGGFAFLTCKYNQSMITDKAHSLASLSTVTTSWKTGTDNFIGVSKLPGSLLNINNSLYYNMMYSSYASADITGLNSYISAMYNDVLNISYAYQLTATDPLSIANTITLPYLQTLGPISMSSTFSYQYSNNISPIISHVANITESTIQTASSSDIMPIAQSYIGPIEMAIELNAWMFNRDYLFQIYNAGNSSIYARLPAVLLTSVIGISIICIATQLLSRLSRIIPICELIFDWLFGLFLFSIAGIIMASSITLSQTCDTLSNAFINGNSVYQKYIFNWVKTGDLYYQNSTNFVNSCLFGTNALSYIYYAPSVSSLDNMASLLNLANNNWNDNYKSQVEGPISSMISEINTIYDNVKEYVKDPSSQDSPTASNMLSNLNSLTLVSSPCHIDDLWVFDLDTCPSTSTVIKSSDPNFANIPIGPASCLSVIDIDPTMFNTRYNPSFISSCDPSNQIYNAYYSLSLYAQSASASFMQVFDLFDDLTDAASICSGHVTSIQHYLYFDLMYLNEAVKGFTSLLNGAALNSDICSNIKAQASDFVSYKCQWAADSSLCFVFSYLIAIVASVYMLMMMIALQQPKNTMQYKKVVYIS